MLKIVTKKLKFVAAEDASITSHVIRVVPEGQAFTLETQAVVVPMPQNVYELPGEFNMSVPGNYTIGVASRDDLGNESEDAVITAFFRFRSPMMPHSLEIL